MCVCVSVCRPMYLYMCMLFHFHFFKNTHPKCARMTVYQCACVCTYKWHIALLYAFCEFIMCVWTLFGALVDVLLWREHWDLPGYMCRSPSILSPWSIPTYSNKFIPAPFTMSCSSMALVCASPDFTLLLLSASFPL